MPSMIVTISIIVGALLLLPYHYTYPLITTTSSGSSRSTNPKYKTESATFVSQQRNHAFIITTATSSYCYSPILLSCKYKQTYLSSSSFTNNNNEIASNSTSSSSTTTTTTTNNDDVVNVKGVTLKMAFDSNPTSWSVSDLKSPPERFTSPSSLDLVHRLRRTSDAVLVGCNTVLRDDCTLTVRRVPLLPDGGGGGKQQPVRVVMDPTLKVLKTKKENGEMYSLLMDGYGTIIYHSLSKSELKEMKDVIQNISKHVTLVNPLLLPLDNNNDDTDENKKEVSTTTTTTTKKEETTTTTTTALLSPNTILQNLSTQFNLTHIMVEGGPYTAYQFLLCNVVNRAILIRAPIVFQQPEVSNIDEHVMKDAGLSFIGRRKCDVDVVEYWCRDSEEWPTKNLEDWP